MRPFLVIATVDIPNTGETEILIPLHTVLANSTDHAHEIVEKDIKEDLRNKKLVTIYVSSILNFKFI